MNIYIKLEVKNRELEGRLLLALAAAERGHSVLLGGQNETINAVLKGRLKPGIIHEKSVPPAERRLRQLRSYGEIGCVCTSQDEESGLLADDYSHFAKRRFSRETLSLLGRAFAWGEHDYQGIIAAFPNEHHKVAVTGNPRVDLWREDMSNYFTHAGQHHSGYILFASNFSSIVHAMPMWQRLEAERKVGKYRDGRVDEFERYDEEAYRIRLVSCFVRAIREVAAVFSNVPVIVRPHPQESVKAWEGILGQHSNVRVIDTGGISAWIRNASVVVHNSCTSALEAAACGKPVISYCPPKSELGLDLPSAAFDIDVPNKVSYRATSEEDLINGLSYVLKFGSLPTRHSYDVARAILSKRFANLLGRLAADRIVDEWEKLDNGRLSERNNWNRIKIVGTYRSAARVTRRLWPSVEAAVVPTERRKFLPLSSTEIDDLVGRFKSSLNRFEHTNVSLMGPKLVLVESNS